MEHAKIVLPDFLIADLYKDTLVNFTGAATATKKNTDVPEKSPIQEEKVPKKTLDFLGQNKRHIAVLVNVPEAQYIQKEDLTFLSNILKACQLTQEDIAIINIAKQKVSFSELKFQLNVAYLLLFSVETLAIQVPFSIPFFQAQKFDGCTIVPAPSLSSINQNTHEGKLLKTKLWMCLKDIFGL